MPREKVQSIMLLEEFDDFLISCQEFDLLEIFIKKVFGEVIIKDRSLMPKKHGNSKPKRRKNINKNICNKF